MLTPDGAGFAELRRSIGAITDSVLSDRLSELARAGLVERTVTDTRPPGVSYRLTDIGLGDQAHPQPARRMGLRTPARPLPLGRHR